MLCMLFFLKVGNNKIKETLLGFELKIFYLFVILFNQIKSS